MKCQVFTLTVLLILGLNYELSYAEQNLTTTTEATASTTAEPTTMVGWLPRRCKWPKDIGFFCIRGKPRWYYDVKEGKCKIFFYQGNKLFNT